MHQPFPSAATRAAAHCDALLKRRSAPRELVQEFEYFGERLALALRPVLSARPVRSLGARAISTAELAALCGPLAANSVHAFERGERSMLLSFEARALLAQLDRAFGGSGDVGSKLPSELPLSADLMAQRMEKQAVAAIAGELGGIELRGDRRGTNVVQLAPFARDAELTVLEFEVTAEAGAPWRIALAVETEALPVLLPRPAASPSAGGEPGARPDPRKAPFADLPLTASATLVDMAVPLHRLAALAPGDVLPIMVERSVPLRIGDTLVARGSVGDVDKQVALQITETFSGKDTQ